MQQVQIAWQDVDSSSVQQIAYDEPSHTVAVKFLGGALYTYDGVGEQVYSGLMNSESVGRYLNTAIKGSYPYVKHNDTASIEEHIKARRTLT